MIIYNLRTPVDCVNSNCVGVTGENLTYVQEFLINGMTDPTFSYSIHLRFPDGQVNSVIPDEVSVDENGTKIVWNVRKTDIFSHGCFELQLEGTNENGKVFQTEIVRLYADESLAIEDREYENPNSETLRLREEAYDILSEIKVQQVQIDENLKQILATDITAKADKATTLAGYGITDGVTSEKLSTELAKKQDALTYDDSPTAGHMTQVMSSHAILMALTGKADKKTTLKGYGITDAYNKSETNVLLSKKADNIFSSQDNYIEQTLSGNVSGSFLSEYSGSEQENTNFEHTAKIPCTAGEQFKVTAAYGFHAPLAVFYNEDESFNSYYLLSASELVTATDEIIEAPVGAAYVAFNNYTPNSVLSVSKNNPVLVTVKEKITENAEKISANSEKISVNSEEISVLKSEIITKADNIYSNDSKFEVVSVTVVQGRYARYDNGKYTESSSFECSEPIACKAGDVFRVSSIYGYSAPLAVFYDSDGNFLGYFNRIEAAWKENAEAEIVTVPENAATVVFNNLSTKAELIIEKGIPISLKEQIENNCEDIAALGKSLLYGKTIYCDGDSVAYGAGSGGYSYCDFIAENNGMKMTKKAVSGTTFAVREGRTDSIFERISALCSAGTEYDYILLEGGFNDMFMLVDIGSVSESDYSGTYDTSTAAGAFEQMCYLLRTTFPDTKILFVLGHRILRGSCDTKQLPYWEVYRSICEKWSIPYADLARESGLTGWKDDETGYAINDTYFQTSSSTGHGDGTHPLKEAYEKFYVPLIEAKLKTL